ncbi:MAG: AcrB/AcrD/AcrF family protein [Candidatus Omnitrophica bacterium]|nr:AcrB/AcrD/AcrF family protein [Candidatus Omnitrophota bacterium]
MRVHNGNYMKISEFSVKHSLLVNLISLFVLIAGVYTLFIYQIRREAFPEVSYDVVLVQTAYPGAPPKEVEKLVTIPLEKELKGVDGIEEMISTSRDNFSTVRMDIAQDVKDKDKVVDEIKQAVDRVTDLPGDAEEPIVTEITSGEIPIIQVALSGALSENELQGHAERLEDILEDIPGVSSISRLGWRDQEVWVEVDPEVLRDKHVSMEEVMEALARRNVTIPGGTIRGKEEYSIRTTGEFYDAEEVADVVIRANEAGNWLRIRDVAGVRFTFEDEDVINKSYGSRSVNLTVIKRATGDAVKIVEEVKERVGNYTGKNDERLKVSYINDIAYYIKRRLGVLQNNGIVGILLVCGVLMVFLNYRIALLTALSLPIAFAATISIMGIMGLSVNLITMFGLIIVLGMLVDDGIIVAENCSRHLERGLSPPEAAVAGTNEVAKPVTATIVTTIAAFGPLMFMEGMLGKFIWGIPLVIIIALICSLFEAFVILPSHFADFVRMPPSEGTSKELHWINRLRDWYSRRMRRVLRRRYTALMVFLALLGATIWLMTRMPFVLFGSEEGIEEFYIRAEMPVGSNLYRTNEMVEKVEALVGKLPEHEVDAYTTQVGSLGETWGFDPYGKSGSHIAQVTVYLTPHQERERDVNEIIEALRPKVEAIEGFEEVYFEKPQAGPPVGKPVAVQIIGEEFSMLEEIAKNVEDYLQSLEGVHDIATDYELGRGEVKIVVDKNRAARAFLTVRDVASSIRTAYKGGVATSIRPVKAEEEIDVRVRFPFEYRDTRAGFAHILIPNRQGDLIPLPRVARLEEDVALARINHKDGKRVITVRAGVDTETITSFEANRKLQEKFSEMPVQYPGYRIEYAGEQEENVRSLRSFIQAFILAGFLIFLILAANFNSLVQPVMVMLAIPFGLIGVVWAFFFHGYTLSFFMMMGIVGLTGIVVNDSIVLVEFINNLRRQGFDRRDSIIEAGRLRLRPVLLTTITTAFGLTPTAYGIGGGDPFLKPMALTIVWGIVCATFLTLVVLPCIYAIVDDVVLRLAGHATVRPCEREGTCEDDGEPANR